MPGFQWWRQRQLAADPRRREGLAWQATRTERIAHAALAVMAARSTESSPQERQIGQWWPCRSCWSGLPVRWNPLTCSFLMQDRCKNRVAAAKWLAGDVRGITQLSWQAQTTVHGCCRHSPGLAVAGLILMPSSCSACRRWASSAMESFDMVPRAVATFSSQLLRMQGREKVRLAHGGGSLLELLATRRACCARRSCPNFHTNEISLFPSCSWLAHAALPYQSS